MLTLRNRGVRAFGLSPLCLVCLAVLMTVLGSTAAHAGYWSVSATFTGGGTPSGGGQLSYKWPGSFSTGGPYQVPGVQTATYSQSLVMPNPRPSQPESGAATLTLNAQIVLIHCTVATLGNDWGRRTSIT